MSQTWHFPPVVQPETEYSFKQIQPQTSAISPILERHSPTHPAIFSKPAQPGAAPSVLTALMVDVAPVF